MNAATETVVEMDVDLDATVPCTVCDGPAEWTYEYDTGCRVCRDLMCSVHRVEQDQRHALATLLGQRWWCKDHHVPVTYPLSWRPI